jgi:hypothetical protein
MRILFASHLSPDDPQCGSSIVAATNRLRAAGHHVHVLIVDGCPTSPERPNVRRVLCSSEHPLAPIHFPAPTFDRRSNGGPTFAELSDRQLSDYRDVLRIEFDREIDLHDPHVVHAAQLWLFAHLALEAGVPYVASTIGEEFDICRADARYRRFVVQAAENAGRILTHGDAAHAGVLELVGELEGRVRRFDLPDADGATTGPWWQPLPTLYRETFVERFGREPD